LTPSNKWYLLGIFLLGFLVGWMVGGIMIIDYLIDVALEFVEIDVDPVLIKQVLSEGRSIC